LRSRAGRILRRQFWPIVIASSQRPAANAASSVWYCAAMNHPNPTPDTALSDDEISACMRVLRAIDADRSLLTRLTQERRRELLTLAGLVAKPERHNLVKLAKAFRRAERDAAKEHDRKVLARGGSLRTTPRRRICAALAQAANTRRPRRSARTPPGARLLRLQETLCENASLLRFHVRCMRRLQLCQT
jgi:hypothetical protein